MKYTLTLAQITQRLVELRRVHRALDLEIAQISLAEVDQMHVKRLKKRKLRLRDSIAQLEAMLIPDEPA